MRIDELKIIKSALENDIAWRKDNHQDFNNSVYKDWVSDVEKLLKKVNSKLSIKLVQKAYLENSRRGV